MRNSSDKKVRIALIIGEESGDMLGANLIDAIRRTLPYAEFFGVAGERMTERGMESLFPVSDVAVMGISAVIARLPILIRRVRQTAAELIALKPDILVIIDSPGFTHAVARRIAAKLPDLPIVNYVSPSVWAWKSWRARQMTRYIDHVLALLPFEPAVHRRLGGPPCTYVGHPLIEKADLLRPQNDDRSAIKDPPVLVVLPGSRKSEIDRLLEPFAEAVALIAEKQPALQVVLPAVGHLHDRLQSATGTWAVKPTIVVGEAEKFAAFQRADVALAASGTVTLELALAHVPMVVAYRVEWIGRRLKRFLKIPSIVLANLIIEENVIPEFIDEQGDPETLAANVLTLLQPGPERQRQLDGFKLLEDKMSLPGGVAPSQRAAEIVLQVLNEAKAKNQPRLDSGV